MLTMNNGIIANRTARHHLLGMWGNALGGGIFDIAIPLIILNTTGSLKDMTVAAVAERAAMLIPGPLVGSIVDRGSPRALLLMGYFGQGMVVAIGALLLDTKVTPVYILALVIYFRGLFDLFSRSGTFSIAPVMYGDKLPEFNAAFRLSWTSASTLGPVIGGFLVVSMKPVMLLWIDAVSFFLMFLVMRSLPIPKKQREKQSGTFWVSTCSGYKHFIGLRGCFRYLISVILSEMAIAPAIVLALYAISHDYKKGPLEISLTLSATSIGLALGSVLAYLVSKTHPQSSMIAGSFIMFCGATLMLAPHWLGVCVGVGILFLGGIFYAVSQGNLVQTRVHSESLGKAMTGILLLETIFGSLSTTAVSTLSSSTSIEVGVIFILVTAVCSGLVLLGSPCLLEELDADQKVAHIP